MMIKSKRQMFTVISVFTLVMLLGSVTYAFFNYTRTGSVNRLATGTINFTSNYDRVTLQNVFPINREDIATDTDNVATISVHIEGNTTYEKGMKYLVTIKDYDNKYYVPLSLLVTSSNLDNVVLTSYSGYWEDTELAEGSIIAAGIIPANTDVNGDIILKAYFDDEYVGISDTYDPECGYVAGQGYICSPTDENGTTEEWVGDREIFTTTKWNELNENGISFKIKVETNVNQTIAKNLPDNITSEKNNIREIYFIKDTDENIETNYNNATVKADMSIFEDGSVKAYLNGDKLYIASSDTIYLTRFDTFALSTYSYSNGTYIYTSPITKIVFDNVNTSRVRTMRMMFFGMSNITHLDISMFDTSNLIDMYGMFEFCSSLENIDLSVFDTSKVTNMENMFYSCSSLSELDISNFNTSNVTRMSSMFSGCTNIEKIYVSDLWTTDTIDSIVIGNQDSSRSMFGYNASTYTAKIVGGEGTTFNTSKTDKEYARIDDPANGKPGYFTYKAYPSA